MGNFLVKKNNVISMIRGDTFDFVVTIEDDETSEGIYYLQNDDALYLGIMDPRQPFECALVKKKYTEEDLDPAGNLVVRIEPEDTENLIPGVYYYSIKLHKLCEAEGIDVVSTVIPTTKFIIVD